MKLVERTLSDPSRRFAREMVEGGHFGSESEAITAALYLLLQDMDREAVAPAEVKALLKIPLETTLAELRQALAELPGQR